MLEEKKTFIVRVIHEFEVEAENAEEACDIVIAKDGYGEAKDCYFEVE